MDKPNRPPEPKPRPSGPSQPGRPDPLAKPKDAVPPAVGPDGKAEEETLRSGIRWGLVASLAAVVLIAIFSVQNIASTDVNFLFWTWRMPLVVLILVVVMLSVVADEFITFWLRRRKRQQLKQTARR